MAASGGLAAETPGQEVLEWLKKLPLAPEYHPSLEEFQDPIAYIFKIEKEASEYGICKIVPPVLAAPKKTATANLNRSLAARAVSCGSRSQPTFTTRQQQIGFCPRKHRPVQRPVWQSGEYYTFQEFEAKAKAFERSYLKKCSKKASFSPLEMETLYWKATVDKPFSVEYANDMPGSAFSLNKNRGEQVGPLAEGLTVGETEWNMRGVSRAKGSLLRFMKEEIPGVTSPMLYIAMMFSWFAWHVEDHDLHSLNYLHMGAGKTWYGVPREAAVAFEEVVRVHGYGEEINPLVTFSVLGEKTTVMSPEVFTNAGVPCCRLVQNAGEFVVTFPRAYHSGFSHGFNCGEAANIATPEWLRVAKDAAIRRASINYPPMVSHFQLLYDLALEICTRVPVSIKAKPRSSRLKDKLKGEGEMLVKELFVKNVTQNNDHLDILGKGSSIVLFPQSSSDIPVCSNLRVGSQLRLNPSLGICSHKGLMKSTKSSISDDIVPVVGHGINQVENFFSMKGKFSSLCERSRFSSLDEDGNVRSMNEESERGGTIHGDKLSNQRLFSCVTCGIWSFDCVAIVQPREAAARYLMSADCSFFNDWISGCGAHGDGLAPTGANASTSKQESPTRWDEKNVADGLYDVPVQSVNYQIQMVNQNIEEPSDSETQNNASALGLLALNYGNSSDSEEDQVEPDSSHGDEIIMANHSESIYRGQSCALPSIKQEFFNDASDGIAASVLRLDCGDEVALQSIDCHAAQGTAKLKDRSDKIFYSENPEHGESNILQGTSRDPKAVSHITTNCSPVFSDTEKAKFSRAIVPIEHADTSFVLRSDEDCLRMHVFCLKHAAEVEQQLRPIGGVNILLLCHPEYPRIEAEAKLVSEELGVGYLWKDISFRDATKDDEEMIQTALDNEDAIPGNGDWAVKLGINLFYSAILSRSPLYSKQMPYNSVIYKAFGRNSPASSPAKLKVYTRRPGKQKKVVAGKWCGKVWMSSQVHPFLAKWDSELHDQEQEQERRFHNLGMLCDEKLESKQQSFNRSATTSFTKSGRRRKLKSENISVKKAKYLETEDAASDDSVELHLKIHGWKETKDIEKGVSYDSLEDDSYWHYGRICRTQQAKVVERDDAVSDESLENNSYQQDHRICRSKQAKYPESKFALAENNFQKQHAKDSRRKQTKWVEVECAFSDDSLEDDGDRWNARVPRSVQTKSLETEDAVSDGSLEESSHWQVGRIFRGKQTKHIEKEVSDDSLEHSSRRQTRRTFGGNCSKYTEREDVVSDNSQEERTYQQHSRFPKSRQAKYIEREEADSDDSLGNKTYQQRRRILKSKRAEFIEMEHAVSDDSVEENTQQPPRRISRSKIAKFIVRRVAASDDVMVDDTRQEPRRIPRRKKAKFAGREDAVLHDLHEGNTHHQLRKTPRGKQTKFIEGENEAWDDLLVEDSNQHSRRVLRNKQNKLRQMKQETPRHVKEEMPRKIKKETTQSFKKEKQMKQEMPLLRSNRKEQNSRQIDSGVEVELEGGPSTRLRRRPPRFAKETEAKLKGKSPAAVKAPAGRKNVKRKEEEAEYQCDIEGCTMSFGSKQELAVHKRNMCPVKGCGKKFFYHKYLVQHRRVHLDDRPLKCPWKGCKMTFKWAWARTEHIRVHTGARPYVCAEEGCGQTFRFVSDFSRHKRKTGHSTKKGRG